MRRAARAGHGRSNSCQKTRRRQGRGPGGADPIRTKKRGAEKATGRRKPKQRGGGRFPEKKHPRKSRARGAGKPFPRSEGRPRPRQKKVIPPPLAVECDSHKQVNG